MSGSILMACAAMSAHGQGTERTQGQVAKECVVVTTGVVVNGVLTTSTTMHGQDTTWVSGGVDAKCEGTDQRILSDSAEHYSDKKLLILIGHVHYTEARLKLDCDRLTYYTGEERLVAEGNVTSITNTGTRWAGPHAVYLRPAIGIRAQSHLDAEPRSSIWVSPKDAGAGSKDSVNIQADHIIMDNDSLVYAKGIVVIERPDLLSTSDSAFMDKDKEFARLTIRPKVVGRGDRHFTLEGKIIDIFSKNHEVERVKSLGDGVATSDDVNLKADTIDLRIAGQKLQRAYAWGRSRAHAKSKDENITADSIEVLMPDQTLRTMNAVGRGVAESSPDTTKIISKQPDFLTGDTIVAQFDSLTPADTARQPAIHQVTARGLPARGKGPQALSAQQATAYYQVIPNGETKTDKPNVNYSLADTIVVTFHDRQVQTVKQGGHVTGFYIEAATDSTKTDSTKAKGDSTKAKPAKKPAETKKP
jgi:lipopolysaccharide export system protein LptA